MSDSSEMTKKAWPSHIAHRLGILPVQGSAGPWHSTGDTTDVAWFREMCAALGISYPGERIRAMGKMVEMLGGTWDPDVHSSLGKGRLPGGNVTKEGFRYLSELLDHVWQATRTSHRVMSRRSVTTVAGWNALHEKFCCARAKHGFVPVC